MADAYVVESDFFVRLKLEEVAVKKDSIYLVNQGNLLIGPRNDLRVVYCDEWRAINEQHAEGFLSYKEYSDSLITDLTAHLAFFQLERERHSKAMGDLVPFGGVIGEIDRHGRAIKKAVLDRDVAIQGIRNACLQ